MWKNRKFLEQILKNVESWKNSLYFPSILEVLQVFCFHNVEFMEWVYKFLAKI